MPRKRPDPLPIERQAPETAGCTGRCRIGSSRGRVAGIGAPVISIHDSNFFNGCGGEISPPPWSRSGFVRCIREDPRSVVEELKRNAEGKCRSLGRGLALARDDRGPARWDKPARAPGRIVRASVTRGDHALVARTHQPCTPGVAHRAARAGGAGSDQRRARGAARARAHACAASDLAGDHGRGSEDASLHRRRRFHGRARGGDARWRAGQCVSRTRADAARPHAGGGRRHLPADDPALDSRARHDLHAAHRRRRR